MPDLIEKSEKSYDPYSNEYTSFKPKGKPYDPYADEFTGSGVSSNPKNGIDKKRLPPIQLRDEEKVLAENYPSIYGALHATTDLFPYASLLIWKSDQDSFKRLDQEDQTMVLLQEALAAALWGKAGPLFKDIGYVGKGFLKPLRPVFRGMGKRIGIVAKEGKVLPYEDAVKGVGRILGVDRGKPFSYGEVVKKKLMGKGFAKGEAEAISSVLQGEDTGRLLDTVLNRKFKGKEPTKAFNKAISWEKGRLYPRPKLRKTTLEEFGEDVVRAKFYNNQFEKVLAQDVYKAKPTKRTTKHIFNAHAKRLFGEEAPKDFGDLTPHQMSNILLDMLENKAVTWQITRPTLMATLKPARIVFGYGEKFLGTLENVYKPVKGALFRTNQSYFNHSLLFSKMLEQRGAGKVVVKASGEFRFKNAKWLTPNVQKEAYGIAMKMDELSGQVRKAGSVAQRDELLAQLNKVAGGASKEAGVLIETWRAYSDYLYSEHMKLQIPRVFRKAGMTELGQSKIDEMMSGAKGLDYEIDRLFSSISQKNPTERIHGAKEVLKKARGRLDYAGEVHPYFKAEGKDLTKTLKDLETQLSWGKGGKGFTPYLENYVARVSQHEDTLLQKWKGGLFKEQSAFYTKIRKLEKQIGEPVDFGTMIQARTMAHAKEHFLYDKIGEVVKYTEGLPPAWIEYVDGYIGGILNVPTMSDYKLSQFLTKTAGGIERMMGKEGLWSEQRVINLSHTINNLTYLGGLGFKPFSAVRNLFQPLLTVPGDMGGLKDLGKLVEGYRWALNPKNRAYIRSLGAIAEYAPEIHLRPSILRQGKMVFGKGLPTIEATRDMAMWMFKGADRFNRYVTGGAANIKWDRLVKRIGEPKSVKMVKYFSKKIGLDRRHSWVKAELEDLLHRGKFIEAKKVYINDIIADTQYLYGAAEAPVAIRKYGAIGRTGLIFQSWWMNYGTLMEKWLMTGSIGAKAERVLTATLSQSMAYMVMEPMWGKSTAIRSTFLGPFPKEFNEFLLPPAWSPIYHAAAAMANIQSPKVSSRHAKAILDSSAILIPGGLQLKAFYKGAKEEGWDGFSRAFLRLRKD